MVSRLDRLSTRVLLLSAVAALAGCPQERPSAKAPLQPDATTAPTLPEIQDGRGLLYSFFDRRARLRTVEQLAGIEQQARSQVMVVDPRRRLEGDRIFVADLRRKAPDGHYPVWIEKKGAWLDRNMPRQSELRTLAAVATDPDPAARKRRRRRRRKPTRKPPPRVAQSQAQPPAQAPRQAGPQVVMFSTAWCPSCKTARAFFAQRNIAVLDLDVEKDPRAAQQYTAVQQRFNLRRGVIPVIVVNGRVFQGFSAPQIEAALAAQSTGS